MELERDIRKTDELVKFFHTFTRVRKDDVDRVFEMVSFSDLVSLKKKKITDIRSLCKTKMYLNSFADSMQRFFKRIEAG